MRKITLFRIMFLAILVAWSGNAFGQGVFTSKATGSWNDPGSWTLSSGTDADGIPDADDNVTIGSAYIITVPASTTVECNNLTVAGVAATSLTMAGANSVINIYGSLAATAAPTAGNYIDCTADVTAKVVFKRSTDGALISGTWGTFGEKVRVEVDLGSGITGNLTVAVKFRELTVKSGTLSTTAQIRPDDGSANSGKVTIENGATIITTSIFTRTSTANTAFASLTMNGNAKLIINGTSSTPLPSVASGFPVYTFSSSAVIEYQGGTQAIADINYPNLKLSAGAKSWALGGNRTVTGDINVVGTAIFQVGGAQLTVSGNVTVDEGAQIGCSNNSGTIVAATAGTQTFTLNGFCRVCSNSTQAPNPTTGFIRQFAFDAYNIGANSIVSFRNPTTSSSVSLNIDQPAGVSFANVEFYDLQTAAYTTTYLLKKDIVVTGSVAFPRAASGQPVVFDMNGFNLKIGKQILNSLGTIGTNVGNTNTSAGTRTYTMSGTVELNGTLAQNTLGGTDLPQTFNNLIINNAAGVTVSNPITVNGTTTINDGTKLAMGATLTANGAVAVNGTFQLNASGWATGTGVWTYGNNATLAFNTTYGVEDIHVYWPTSNGPVNVSVLTGVLNLNNAANRTVNGLFQTAGGVGLNSSTLTLNGTVQINAGGYFNNAPVYGAASILKYNTGDTYGRGTEWNSPANVQISNNSTLNFPNTGSGAFSTNMSITGNLTVDAGSALYMDYGGGGNKSGRLTVGGNVVLNGNLSLGNAVGGDLYVGGNWTRAASGSGFNTNSREVRFNGSTNQSISNSGGETFAYLTIDNAAGNVVTLNDNVSVTNDMSVNASSALTNASEKTLAVTGNFTINSSETGTGTFKNNGTLTVSGTSKVQQYLTNQSWYLTSPLQGTVTPTNLSRIQGYNEGVGTGNDWSASGTTMTAGKGYITSVSSAPNTVEFSGTINGGNISIPMTRLAAGTENKYGFNLIGNPYTAYLDWTAVSAANSSKMPTSTMWYRTKASGSWNFSTVNGSGETVPANVSYLIPPMQAFWVRAANVGNSTLELTTAMVSHDNNTTNKLKAPAVSNAERTRIRLEVSNSTNKDELLIYTDPQALDIFDAYDSPKMSNENVNIPEISCVVGSESLVINGLNSLILDTNLPVRFMTKTANAFTLKASQISNLPDGVKVILKDYGNEFDLTNGSEYNFTSDVTDNSSRFNLVFRSPGAVTGMYKNTESSIQAFTDVNGITIQLNDLKLIGSDVSVYNSSGQELIHKQINNSLMHIDYKFNPDVYLVRVNNVVKKMIVR